MASHHYDYHRSRRHEPPEYSPREHTEWAFRMRQYLRTEQPLGLQICEGEITIEDPQPYDHAARDAAESLALTRSNSYSLTDGSDFRSLFAGTPADGEPDHGSPARRQDSSATTIYKPLAEAQQPGDPSSGATDTATPPEGDEDRQDGSDRGARARQALALRRSPRLRANEGKQPEGQQGPSATGAFPGADKDATPTPAAAAAEGGSAGSHDSQDGDGADPVDDSSGDGSGVLQSDPRTHAPGGSRDPPRDTAPAAEGHTARVERLEHTIYELKKHAETDTTRLKALVNRAKAIATLLRQTIDPNLWARLPAGIRREAFNQANAKVWGIIQTSLGYAYTHLIGQLSEGDGKGAWDRLVHLHAEETNGAQAHYLQELMACSYERAARTHECGHVRLYAQALQRINRLYKLSAGHFVQPEILMCRLLTLPGGYDPIVENIEQINVQRAASGSQLGPLDFHEVLQKIAQFENRRARRCGERRLHRQFPHARTKRYDRKPRGRPGRAHLARTGGTGRPKHNELCWRCGKPGHYARECREDVSAADTARGQQARQQARQMHNNANLARGRARNHRHNGRSHEPARGRGIRRAKKPAIGFLAVESPSQALIADDRTAKVGTVIIDSGASGSFCVSGTPLKNARATRRTISSAGSQTLIGRAVGDWGCLRNTVAITGLRQGLASVGSIADDYQAILLFTPNKVYAIPEDRLREHLRAEYEIGERDETGLYMGTIKQMNKVLTTQRGFQPPRNKQTTAMTALERRTAEGQVGLYALSAKQETTKQVRAQTPGRAQGHSSQLRPRGGRLQRRDPERTEGVHSLKQTVRGDRPRHPMSIRTLSGGCGAPIVWREGPGKPQHRHVQFIGLCCDIKGHAPAGLPARCVPVAPVDSCTKLTTLAREHTVPTERADLVENNERPTVTDERKGDDAHLSNSPHSGANHCDLEAHSEMIFNKQLTAAGDQSTSSPAAAHAPPGSSTTSFSARTLPAADERAATKDRLNFRQPVGVTLQTTQSFPKGEATSGETSRTGASQPLKLGPEASACPEATATHKDSDGAPSLGDHEGEDTPPQEARAADNVSGPSHGSQPRMAVEQISMKIHSDTVRIRVLSMGPGKYDSLQVLIDERTRFAWIVAFKSEPHDRSQVRTPHNWAKRRLRAPNSRLMEPQTTTVTGYGRPELRRFERQSPETVEHQQKSKLEGGPGPTRAASPPDELSNGIARQAIKTICWSSLVTCWLVPTYPVVSG